jgi:hypothetical protein
MAKFWGVECKGCGMKHPTAIYRHGDVGGRYAPNETFQYGCPHDNTSYSYEGKDEIRFDYVATRRSIQRP